MTKVKIAVVQFETKKESYWENIDRAENFIKLASKKKADLIVFPENFLSFYSDGDQEFIDKRKLCKKNFVYMAKKYNIDIVCGSVLEKNVLGKEYNVAYYINSSGKIKARYKKIHLWYPEKPEVSPGHKIKVFDTKFGKVGLIICWDLIFPEIFRKMVKKGVEIVICPSNWSFGDAGKGLKYDKNSEIKLIDSVCVERAFEEEVILVFCNTAKKEADKDVSIGHS